MGETPQGGGEPFRANVESAAAPGFLRHPDSEVRLWAARCLVEGFRIFAPEPPLGSEQLRAALVLFVEQLSALGDHRGAAFVHAIGLLERITEIRVFMLAFEFEHGGEEPGDGDWCGELLAGLARACLRAARVDHAKVLEGQLTKLLADVLAEADGIPEPVLAALLAELEAEPCATRARQQSFGGSLARQVFAALAPRGAVLSINEYLNAALFGPPREEEQQALDDGAREVAAMTAERRGTLLEAVHELAKIDVALVARVLPNLQLDLACKELARRRAATGVVGRVLAQLLPTATGERGTLAERYPSLFSRFLERLADAEESVRLVALNGVQAFLLAMIVGEGVPTTATKELAKSLGPHLAQRCLDPSDAVRVRLVEVSSAVAAASADGLALLQPVLRDIFGRVMDKRPIVRETCAEQLGHLHACHVLPAWTEGRFQDVADLKWTTQLFCEAFHVFAQNRLGFTGPLESLVEQYILGFGAGLTLRQHAQALMGLCQAAYDEERAAQGFALLLGRKREAHAVLRQFVNIRMAAGGPILCGAAAPVAVAPGLSSLRAQGGKTYASDALTVAVAALEQLVKLSPDMEDRAGRFDTVGQQLRALDAVDDHALWLYLDRLSDPAADHAPTKTRAWLAELDRLLKVHRLTSLLPLLRRALVSTWLLPVHVAELLTLWGDLPAGAGKVEGPNRAALARKVFADLPKYFPAAFLPHVGIIADRLASPSVDDAQATLCALAALGRHGQAAQVVTCAAGSTLPVSSPKLDVQQLVDGLLQTVETASGLGPDAENHDCPIGVRAGSCASACRKTVRAFGLLDADAGRMAALERALQWADRWFSLDADTHAHAVKNTLKAKALALHIAAACLETLPLASGRPPCSDEPTSAESVFALRDADRHAADRSRDRWRAAAEGAASGAFEGSDVEVRCAAIGVCAAAGAEGPFLEALAAAGSTAEDVQLHAVLVGLRGLRRGTLAVSTSMVSLLAEWLSALIPHGVGGDTGLAALLKALQKMQGRSARGRVTSGRGTSVGGLGLADRLRVCTTLPAIFALAIRKTHRDTAQRVLQTSLFAAAQRKAVGGEPLLDYAVACFVHFLSRLDFFLAEAKAPISAFPESSKVAHFFCEALLRGSEQGQPAQRNTELAEFAGAALRVCDRVRHFADRERPSSDAIHKAACVLRHVVEGSWPELGSFGRAPPAGDKACGYVPADLFVIIPRDKRVVVSRFRSLTDGPQAALPAGCADAPVPASGQPLADAWKPERQTAPQTGAPAQAITKRLASVARPMGDGLAYREAVELELKRSRFV